MKSAMIFGVTGQDGSYLAELLLGLGYYVVGVNRRISIPNTQRIQHLLHHDRFHVVHGDVTDATSVFRLLHKYHPHEVYNLSAQSHVRVSFDEPVHTTQAVYLGCLNILEGIRTLPYQDGNVKLYQASSSEMFGSMYSHNEEYDQYSVIEHDDWKVRPPKQVYTDWMKQWYSGEDLDKIVNKRHAAYCVGFQDENTPLRPCSPYAVAKTAAHNACAMYREAYGMHISCGILFNHESPRRGEEFVTRKITKYVGKYFNGHREPLKLGNLDAIRDWGFAGDYVEAMHAMVQRPQGDDFVIATGETHTVREFLVSAFEAIGVKEAYALSMVEIDENMKRPSEVPMLKGRTSKAEEVLGWKPKTSFDGLVKMMVDYDRLKG
jgi:GDPmannose 4,6-dehydratase